MWHSTLSFCARGQSSDDFRHPPFTLIGQHDSRAAQTTASLYESIASPLLIVPLKVAEMVKYANNAFHALKVTFANEIGSICKQQGIDSHQVMDIFCMDDKAESVGALSQARLRLRWIMPAEGHTCLAVSRSPTENLDVPLLEAILPSNRLQLQRGYE